MGSAKISRSTDRRLSLANLWRVLLLFVLGLSTVAAPAIAQPGPSPGHRHIAVELVPESRTPTAGKAMMLAIHMSPEPGWHGYWSTPGDAGLAPKLAWTLPAGVGAGAPSYPVPGRLFISGMMNYVYDRPYALLVPITIGDSLAVGATVPVRLHMSYLACTHEVCLPETADFQTELTVGDGAPDPAAVDRFDAWRAALPATSTPMATHSFKDGRLRLAVTLPADAAIARPYLFVDATDAVNFAAPQSFFRNGDKLIVETAAAGSGTPDRLKVLVDLGGGRGVATESIAGAVPAGGDPIVDGPSAERSGGGILLLTLTAFAGAVLGGLILNVMPCVFPILSLKALSLARSEEDNRAARREAVAYSAGIIAVCMMLGATILGLRAAGDQVGWAFQLQSPAVVFGLLLLVGLIAFNLAGLFEFGSISAGSGLAAKPGASGAFWTGALAAFVATPCTGPFMATALGAALVLPVAASLLVFMGLGLGLALPFIAIGFVPALRRKLPKPGAWMNTFRHLLALPMFVTAIGLAWVLGNQTGTFGIIIALTALLVLAVGLWATGLKQRQLKSRSWVAGGIAAILAISLAAFLPQGGASAIAAVPHGRERFDAAKLAALRAEGKPVFLYLTAAWCLTCKVNEKVAIERRETQGAFAKAGVVTMVGDWTGGDAAITTFLSDNRRSGVPLYLWYAPGKEGAVLPQVLTPSMLIKLADQA